MLKSQIERWRESKRFIINIAVIGIITVACIIVYNWFFSTKKNQEIILDDTPLKVEQIKAILELNTLKFKDEVVVDSTEMYSNATARVRGSLEKMLNLDQFKNGIEFGKVKRELTLIVKGELLYGVDLKKRNFKFETTKDSVFITIPTPELLSISKSPKNTEIYVENGIWNDHEKSVLEQKAIQKMIRTGQNLKLAEKAKIPLEKLLLQLVKTTKKIKLRYY
jgi:adenylate kinase family enzyme